MKIFMTGAVIDLKNLTEQELENFLQQRYNDWLGNNTVTVQVSNLEHKKISVVLYRKYGDWYDDPQRFSEKRNTIFQLDEQLILGTGYQTGSYADLSKNNCRYVIREDITTIFLPKWKGLAKQNHCSRIKNIEFEDFLDHFELSIELV